MRELNGTGKFTWQILSEENNRIILVWSEINMRAERLYILKVDLAAKQLFKVQKMLDIFIVSLLQ